MHSEYFVQRICLISAAPVPLPLEVDLRFVGRTEITLSDASDNFCSFMIVHSPSRSAFLPSPLLWGREEESLPYPTESRGQQVSIR